MLPIASKPQELDYAINLSYNRSQIQSNKAYNIV
jgi:hypothetical protein